MGWNPTAQSLRPQMLALLLMAVAPLAAHADDTRISWTTSRVIGTPDPPRPYTVEPAFPKLKFNMPLALSQLPGTKSLVVAEFGGKVHSFAKDSNAESTHVVVDLAPIRPGFTALYGLAFHPQFATNRQVFLCYVLQNNKPDGSRVSRFTMTQDDPPKIDPDSEQVLLTFLSGGHNGGCLQFGRDGYLYIATGDAADPTPPDLLKTGQDLSDLLSSILRIDVDHKDADKPYRIPPDNPFINTPKTRAEIWAYGFRNPWRMSFDKTTGDLWVGDVGWELWEMIHRVERGGNYGWSIVEGHQAVRPNGQRGPTPILPPIVEHPHSESASITGGYVYRGTRLKELAGTYIYGDYQSGKVWGFRYNKGQVSDKAELADTGLRLVSFGEDDDGELYLLEYERTNQVYRLIPNAVQRTDREFPRTLSATGLFASTPEHLPAAGVIPFTINAQAWADGTHAERFLAIPGTGQITVSPEGDWNPSDGTVLARTVSVDLIAGDPKSRRRIETQILHREDGSWRPYTYAWDDAQRDATLVDTSGATRPFIIRDVRAPGGQRELAYRMSARSECVLCHNPWVGSHYASFGRQSASPLAFNAAQFDRNGPDDANQIARLVRQDYFATPTPAKDHPKLVDPYDESADLNARARSYLQVNCAHCHQFNAGGTTTILLSAALKLEETKTIDATPAQGTFGIGDAKVIAPGTPERSVLYYRIAKTGAGRMPRTGSHQVDARGAKLIADWIAAMPRPESAPTLAPNSVFSLNTLKDGFGGSPEDHTEAIRRLTQSTHTALALLREIDRGEIREAIARQTASKTISQSAEIRDLFERFLPDGQRIKRLGDAINPDAILTLKGDAERGRTVFFAESATQCKSCHGIGGMGTSLGPDLDAIGTKYPRLDLLRHILEPSREIDPKFATFVVATKEGQVFTGLLTEKTAEYTVLRDAQNKTIRIPIAEIEQQQTRPISLMPEGLLKDLTAEQAADLLEFLAGLKSK